MSWIEPGEDYRPTVWPLPSAVLGYWCSGVTDDDSSTLVAWVQSATEDEAWAVLASCWPSGCRDQRFCLQRDALPGDRFRPPSWALADGRWPEVVSG